MENLAPDGQPSTGKMGKSGNGGLVELGKPEGRKRGALTTDFIDDTCAAFLPPKPPPVDRLKAHPPGLRRPNPNQPSPRQGQRQRKSMKPEKRPKLWVTSFQRQNWPPPRRKCGRFMVALLILHAVQFNSVNSEDRHLQDGFRTVMK